jgi:hypothetical protein
MLAESGLTLTECVQNSVLSEWFVDLRIGGEIIIQQPFYTGYGLSDVPTNLEWRNALIMYLPTLYNYGYTYSLNGNTLIITSLSSSIENISQTVTLDVGINININCND